MPESNHHNSRLALIPEDLASVIRFDPFAETDPEEVGLTKNGIDAIWRAVINLYRTGIHPAIAICLRRHGRIVLNRSIGHTSGNGPGDGPHVQRVVATPATPFCMFSASKAVLAMLLHKLAERRQIQLADPLCRYVPEFGTHGKRQITIHHALTHTGGFPEMPQGIGANELFDFDSCLERICALKPRYQSGSKVAYHPISAGFVLAEVVKRASGKDVGEFLREVIQEPLGFRHFTYGASKEHAAEVARNYVTGSRIPHSISRMTKRFTTLDWNSYVALTNDARCFEALIPTVNLIATAEEMSCFYQLLLDGGVFEGKRLFHTGTVQSALEPASSTLFDRTLLMPMRYSAGFMLGNPGSSLYFPYYPEAFTHWGFSSMVSWADPFRDIAACLLNSGKPFLGMHVLTSFRLHALIKHHCPRVAHRRRHNGNN